MWLALEMAMIGMGTVFVFLVVLIFLTQLMSKIVAYLETHHINQKISDERLIKIIQAAIQQHRVTQGTKQRRA